MIDDKAQDAIMEAYDRTILNEFKENPDFKKAYQKMIEAVHDAFNASSGTDTEKAKFDVYGELKKISKQTDMLTTKLMKAKII